MDKESERTSYAHPPAILRSRSARQPIEAPSVDESGLAAEDDEVKVYGEEDAAEEEDEEKHCSTTLVEDKHELVNFGMDRILAPDAHPSRASFFSPLLQAHMAQCFANWWPTAYNAAAAVAGASAGAPGVMYPTHPYGFAFSTAPVASPMQQAVFMPRSPALRNVPTQSMPVFEQPLQNQQQRPQRPALVISQPPPVIEPPTGPRKPHVKKPLNAFMLYMREERPKLLAESDIKESAVINATLGQRWHALSNEDKSKYFRMATEERLRHMEEHPDWSARDNYGVNKKGKRKRERERTVRLENSDLPRKCRARFGVENPEMWCKPCRRKKKCIRFGEDDEPIANEGNQENEDAAGESGDEEELEGGAREAKRINLPVYATTMPLVYAVPRER